MERDMPRERRAALEGDTMVEMDQNSIQHI